MKRILISLFTLALATLACAQGTSSAQSSSAASSMTSTPVHPSRGFTMGIAGLIPRNYPNPSSADWQDLYDHLSETGEMIGVYTAWSDSPESEGQPPKVLKTAFDLPQHYGITPMVALSFFSDTVDGKLTVNMDFKNADQRGRAVETAKQVAAQYKPPYLALGIEVNRLYAQDRAAYNNYVSLYDKMYDAIKAISPETKVFPIFQYELMRGGVYFSGDEQAEPQWDLLKGFGSRLDLAAFTTYPFLLYASPEDLPDNYYSTITHYTDQPIAFTEIGWPSTSLSTQPDSPFGGTPDEQSVFVNRFFVLNQGNPLKLALWSFPHDVGNGFNPAFTSISLRTNDGQAKPGLATWEKYVQEK